MTLVLLALLSLQNADAASVLKGIEEAVLSAPAASLKCTFEIRPNEKSSAQVKGEATLLRKGDANARIETVWHVANRENSTLVICNGKRAILKRNRGDVAELSDPPSQPKRIVHEWVHDGMIGTLLLATSMDKRTISNVEHGADDQTYKTLVYSESLSNAEKTVLKVKIWYDPKTRKVVKRTLDSDSVSAIERYDSWDLNPEIPEDSFKMP